MASTRNLELAASPSRPFGWDVFLSFCGIDTRTNFISHLYFALDQAGILTFRDDPALQRGEGISVGLLRAIRDSNMFVVVISKNYAGSSWCLDELVEILRCPSTESRVIPVFYYVDPSYLRQRNMVISQTLEYPKEICLTNYTEKWEYALAEIAGLSGYHLKTKANENESETIQKIIEDVKLKIFSNVLHLEKHLPGIDFAVEEIYLKLGMELNHVCAVGICGMGGIGKTTTAKAFYNKYSNRFDVSCFVDKVKQYSQGGSPLLPLLNQVLTGILRKKDYKVTNVASGFRQLKHILCFKNVLIVLDDLDQSSYSEFLVTLCNFFSSGSRIIVTTRDVNLLNQLRVDITEVVIYMMKKLGEVDSLELFSYHAFGRPTPPADLIVLSKSFVRYAGGLPLALKVLGSSLRGREHDESYWKAKLKKVGEIPEKMIMEILQQSFDELDDETMKSIFLDIAFFFIGKYKDDAFMIFKSCNFFPEIGIPTLVDRCLLTIDENDKFQMHDLIQEMGMELAKKRHLILRENALEDLQNQKESYAIEGLIVDLTRSTEKQIKSHEFEKFPNLRLLELINVHDIRGDFENSFPQLRCIYWSYCSWTRLPSTFQSPKLVSLHMPFSCFNILWNDARLFRKLKAINVEYSLNLKTTPEFEYTSSVEQLHFRGCESLLTVHPSIRYLTNLNILDLRECTLLKEFSGQLEHLPIFGPFYIRLSGPIRIRWVNMTYLQLGHCSNLKQLPEQLGDLKMLELLDASYTTVEELPDSITQLTRLFELDLSNCKKLRKLPEQIGNMQGLQTFSASCSEIEQLPESFVCLIFLKRLDLRYCKNLENLPYSIWKLQFLRVLHLDFCSKLEKLPEHLGKMQCLEELYASDTAIGEVPDSIGLLSSLQLLDLTCCENLKYVPYSVGNITSLRHLYLLRADSGIVDLPYTIEKLKLVSFTLNCNMRLWLPRILSFPTLRRLILCDEGESLSSTMPFSLSELYKLQFLELNRWARLGLSFPELPLSLTHLNLSHGTLVHLPNLSSLKQLKKLDICNCNSLESLPPLPPHLQSLTIYDCRSLQDPSDMSMLKDLVEINYGSYLQVRRRFLSLFKDDVPKIAKWFSYKSSGRILCFDIPPLLGDEYLGLALWVLFTSKNNNRFNLRAVVTNKTSGITKECGIPVVCDSGAEAYSVVGCIR